MDGAPRARPPPRAPGRARGPRRPPARRSRCRRSGRPNWATSSPQWSQGRAGHRAATGRRGQGRPHRHAVPGRDPVADPGQTAGVAGAASTSVSTAPSRRGRPPRRRPEVAHRLSDVAQEGVEVERGRVERVFGVPDHPVRQRDQHGGWCEAGPSRVGKIAVWTGSGRDRSARVRTAPSTDAPARPDPSSTPTRPSPSAGPPADAGSARCRTPEVTVPARASTTASSGATRRCRRRTSPPRRHTFPPRCSGHHARDRHAPGRRPDQRRRLRRRHPALADGRVVEPRTVAVAGEHEHLPLASATITAYGSSPSAGRAGHDWHTRRRAR